MGPILQGINTALSAAQQIMGDIFNFERTVVYPQQAINNAQALVGQVQGIYNAIRGIWNISVRSATLPNPQQLKLLLSRNPASDRCGFTAVYTPLPASTEAHPSQRDLIDSSDAVAQAAMKRSIAIDAIADQELAAADQMISVLQAPRRGLPLSWKAWLVRSNAYTAGDAGSRPGPCRTKCPSETGHAIYAGNTRQADRLESLTGVAGTSL